MRPRSIIRLGPRSFQNEASGLGTQLVQLLATIHPIRPDLSWYAADVRVIGHFPVSRREALPNFVGNTVQLIGSAQRVEQFESAVFAGVPSSIHNPTFRAGGLWTEADEAADLGDAMAELRAFDTSYWFVATVEAELSRAIVERFRHSSIG